MKKTLKLLLLLLLVLTLAGCWDRVEIEERGFVVGIGIDFKNDKDREKGVYEATYQFVVPMGIGGPTTGGGEEKAYMNVSEKGDNMFQIGRDMTNQVARSPYYEHLQLLVLSGDVVKKQGNLSDILDFFLREHEMRRSKKIFISKGSAKEVLDFRPNLDKLPSMYIDSISENNYKTAILIEPARIGDVQEFILEENNFLIPAIKRIDENVELEGAAVFRGDTNALVGYVNERDLSSINFITNEVKGGALKTTYKDELVIYEVQRAKSEIETKGKSEEDIEFIIKIGTEGTIVASHENVDFSNPDEVAKIEKALEESLEKQIKETTEKVQKELKVDILGLNRVLEQRKYDTWQKIKKNWDRGEGTFPASKIKVEADIKIRTTGASGQSSK